MSNQDQTKSSESEKKVAVQTGVKGLVDPYAELDEQKLTEEIVYVGIFQTGAVEEYEYEGKKGKSGFIQITKRQRDDGAALELLRIKCREDQKDVIDFLIQNHSFKVVRINCNVTEGYGGKLNRTLSDSQPFLKLD